MTVEVRFVDEAVAELDDAGRWYEQRRTGLGLSFLAAVDRAVESIERWPRAAGLVGDVSAGLEVRRVLVTGFPYFVAYLLADDAIVVLAVAHERRYPLYWSERAGS